MTIMIMMNRVLESSRAEPSVRPRLSHRQKRKLCHHITFRSVPSTPCPITGAPFPGPQPAVMAKPALSRLRAAREKAQWVSPAPRARPRRLRVGAQCQDARAAATNRREPGLSFRRKRRPRSARGARHSRGRQGHRGREGAITITTPAPTLPLSLSLSLSARRSWPARSTSPARERAVPTIPSCPSCSCSRRTRPKARGAPRKATIMGSTTTRSCSMACNWESCRAMSRRAGWRGSSPSGQRRRPSRAGGVGERETYRERERERDLYTQTDIRTDVRILLLCLSFFLPSVLIVSLLSLRLSVCFVVLCVCVWLLRHAPRRWASSLFTFFPSLAWLGLAWLGLAWLGLAWLSVALLSSALLSSALLPSASLSSLSLSLSVVAVADDQQPPPPLRHRTERPVLAPARGSGQETFWPPPLFTRVSLQSLVLSTSTGLEISRGAVLASFLPSFLPFSLVVLSPFRFCPRLA